MGAKPDQGTDNPRYIDTVKLSNGETVTLMIPTMGEVITIMTSGPQTWLEVVIPAATQRSWQWFLELSLLDGSIILNKLTPTFKEMTATIQAMSEMGTRH